MCNFENKFLIHQMGKPYNEYLVKSYKYYLISPNVPNKLYRFLILLYKE